MAVIYGLIWWLIVQILGWVALPVVYRLFRWLPDRGYSFAKATGLLLASYILWMGASTGFLRNDAGGILFAIALAASISIGLYWRNANAEGASLFTFLRGQKALVFTSEILFTLAFATWVILRAYAPDKIMNTGGEKFMEIAFLNGVLNSAHFPPLDPWLSGFSISYYYFGYLMMALATRLSSVPAEIGFDLYDALLFALTMQGAFGVVYNLVATSGKHVLPTTDTSALKYGLLGSLFVAVLGNLEGVLEVFYSSGILPPSFWSWIDIPGLPADELVRGTWLPGYRGGWWWWHASRVLQDRDLLYRPISVSPITEFPFFSFLLGDNHPHVLALPFVLVSMGVALNLLNRQASSRQANQDIQDMPSPGSEESTNDAPAPRPGAQAIRHFISGILINGRLSSWNPILITLNGDWPLFLFSALLLGGLGFLNTWDLPIYLGLAAAAYGVGLYISRKHFDIELIFRVIVLGLSLGLAAVLLYAFFYLSFSSQAGGLLPYIFPPTRLPQYLVMFGPFTFILACFLITDRIEQNKQAKPFALIKTILKWWAGILLACSAVFALILAGVSFSDIARQFIEQMRSDPASPLGGLDLNGLLRAILLARLRDPWLLLLVSALLGLGISGFLSHLRRAQHAEPQAGRLGEPGNHLFAYLLLLAGILLTFSVEFFYLRDNFGVRMNTVFKFYYQGWVMMGCASAYGLWWIAARIGSSTRSWWSAVILSGSGALILAGMVYPVLAYYSRAQGFQSKPELNGAATVARWNPDDWAAIEWLRQHGKQGNAVDVPIILEAPGKSYNYEGRISAFTGFPTVLGWSLHEGQWRGSYEEQARREPDIAAIYSTSDEQLALDLLSKWDVRYVIVGDAERNYVEEYCRDPNRVCNPGRALDKFNQILEVVFTQGGTTIYLMPWDSN